jgi:hypothetical protein
VCGAGRREIIRATDAPHGFGGDYERKEKESSEAMKAVACRTRRECSAALVEARRGRWGRRTGGILTR